MAYAPLRSREDKCWCGSLPISLSLSRRLLVRPTQNAKPMMSDDTEGLKAAIERQHGGTATFIGTELVTDVAGADRMARCRQVYALTGEAQFKTVYAWLDHPDGSGHPPTGTYGSESRLDQHGVGCGKCRYRCELSTHKLRTDGLRTFPAATGRSTGRMPD
jgi:hypothetical protein